MDSNTIRLTQYSHGAGCGCKISPQVLSEILGHPAADRFRDPRLLVGYDNKDDAAVFGALKQGQHVAAIQQAITSMQL